MSKNYITVATADLDQVNFRDPAIRNRSAFTSGKNLAGDVAMLKYTGDTVPTSIANITSASEPMTHEQAMTLVRTASWAEEVEL